MPESEHHESEHGKDHGPKGEKRREQIIAAAAVAGVLLTVVLIKRSGGNAAQTPLVGQPISAQNPAPTSQGSFSSGVSPADFYNLQSQVHGLSDLLSAMSAAPGPVGGTNPPTSSPTRISRQPHVSGPPADAYAIGQVVNGASGERVVQTAYSSRFGWLNETDKGGIYTSGGKEGIGTLPFGGSYLGYAASTANPAAEMAVHGQFAGGGPLQVLPGGGYVETNARGEHYQFGA